MNRPPQPPDRPPGFRPAADTTPDDTRDATRAGLRELLGFLSPAQRSDELGRLGPYRVLGELGRGGMGIVFLAEEIDLKRRVALKVMHPDAASDPSAVARFQREAQAQAKVEHDHIIVIYRVGTANGVPFIAMPLLKGQTLAAALKQNARPPVAELVRIGREIAEGLAAAHAVRLIHRDIKPNNIWLEGSNRRVKILDFGLARMESSGTASVPDRSMTVSGAIMGTPAYMSPEQARSQPVDHRTDLFSLGVVLYQMATGQRPFEGASTFDQLNAVVSHDPPAVRSLAPDVPPALSDLIERLMAKSAADRPASAAEVAAALGAVPVADSSPWTDLQIPESSILARHRGHDTAPTVAWTPGQRDPRPPVRRRRQFQIGCTITVTFCLLAVGVVVMPRNRDRDVARLSKSAPDDSPKTGTPNSPPRPAVKSLAVPDSERAAAEQLLAKAQLTVLIDDGPQPQTVAVGGKLPDGRITVTIIDFARIPDREVSATYVANTFLPAVSTLKKLTEVRMNQWQMRLSADDIRLMSGMPLTKTLGRLDAAVELTAEAIESLKKFDTLKDITFSARKPTDALFVKLTELKPPDLLAFVELPLDPNLTDKGWAALARFQIGALTLVESKAAPAAFRAFTAKGVNPRRPGLEFLGCVDLTDETLRELSERETDVRILAFEGNNFTDAGIQHLVAVKSLKGLILRGTKVTEAGAQALAAARPDLRITWGEKVFEPKKKP